MSNNADSNQDAESIGSSTSSFVMVADPKDDVPVLTMDALAQYDRIGLLSERNTSKVCVTVKAMVDELADSSRAPVDVMVVLDKSGSMRHGKLRDCQHTLATICPHLTSRDRLGLVSFSRAATLEFPAQNMTPENKELLKRKVDMIRAGGGTNLSGGLSLGAMEMARTIKPNPIRSIFLLTDGHANSGIRNTSDLVAMVRNLNPEELPAIHEMEIGENQDSAAPASSTSAETSTPPSGIVGTKRKSPISLFCFGYGGDHNSQMLQEISDATPGGAYYFVENDGDVATAFGDAIGGLLSVVAQSACVNIAVPHEAKQEGVSIEKIYHKQAIKRGDDLYTVNIGDMYAEESRDILVEIRLANTAPNSKPIKHLEMTLNYMDTVNKQVGAFGPIDCRIARPPTDEVPTPNEHVETQWLRIQTAQAIEEADTQARGNDLIGAQTRLQTAMSMITGSPFYPATQERNPMIYAMQMDIQDVQNGFRSVAQHRSAGTHVATNKRKGMASQRCMESKASYNVFRSSKKAKMCSDFRNSDRNPGDGASSADKNHQQQQMQLDAKPNVAAAAAAAAAAEQISRERILLSTRVLMKYIEKKYPALRRRAKHIIKDCAERKKRQESGYDSVAGSMRSRLIDLVGERRWNRADAYARSLLEKNKNKKQEAIEAATSAIATGSVDATNNAVGARSG